MSSELQRLVESLGRRLKRSVAVDDPRLSLLAYSSHYGVSDEARRISILERRAPAFAVEWAEKHNIASATGATLVPAEPALGIQERYCVPIRSQNMLLGYLWLIEGDPPLSSEELEVAERSTAELAVVLYREQLHEELVRTREGAYVRDLLSDDALERRDAAAALSDADLFAAGPVAAVVASVFENGDAHVDESVRVALALALEKVRRLLNPRHGLHLVRHDHGLLIVGTDHPSVSGAGLVDLARSLQEDIERRLSDEGSPLQAYVGIGKPQDSLEHFVVSYRQAMLSVRVAHVVRTLGKVAEWRRLGVYSLLARIPPEELTEEIIPPALLRLLQRRGEHAADALLETLECYLDLGGDTRATAAKLFVHRATLYYRLRKIEDIADVDLKNGDDRLSLHLGLKLARLVGLMPN